MYVDGYMLLAIYAIAVLALAVSVYALWSLEEIRRYYKNSRNKTSKPNAYEQYKNLPPIKVNRAKGHWD
jgi:flagellar basal body-associated protein FliL